MQVFVVLKNADFTEGRGPMFFDKAFANKADAHNYIMDQDGIYGSSQGPSSYGVDCYNGYEIKTIDLISSYDASAVAMKRREIQERRKEIERLQAELKKLES